MCGGKYSSGAYQMQHCISVLFAAIEKHQKQQQKQPVPKQ